MALVKDPLHRAQAVSTKHQAAILHTNLEAEIGLSDPDELPAGWEDEAEQALRLLEDRYGAQALRDSDEGRAGPTSISRTAKANLPTGEHGEVNHHEAARTAERHARREHAAGRPKRAARRRAAARGLRARSTIRTITRTRAARATGLPQAAVSSSDLFFAATGALAGLSLLYLILNEQGHGPSAVNTLFGGIAGFLRRFVEPVDIFASTGGGSGQTRSGQTRSGPSVPVGASASAQPTPLGGRPATGARARPAPSPIHHSPFGGTLATP